WFPSRHASPRYHHAPTLPKSNLEEMEQRADWLNKWLVKAQNNLTRDSIGAHYLKSRGLPFDFCKEHGLGYCDGHRVPYPHFDKSGRSVRRTRYGRVVIPTRDQSGLLLNLYGRDCSSACAADKALRHAFIPGGTKGFV